MVSLLVSFTLTPMMSARMLRARCGPERARRIRVAGRLLRADRALRTCGCSVRRCDHRLARRWRRRPAGPRLRAALWPGAPGVHPQRRRRGRVRGHGAGARGHEHQCDERKRSALWSAESARCPASVSVLAVAGASTFLGGVNQANLYVRIAPHEERLFSVTRSLQSLARLQPLEAFRGTTASGR